MGAPSASPVAVQVFADADRMVPAAGRVLADLLRERARDEREGGRPVSLVLSGGSTPQRLYEWLAQDQEVDIPWQRTALFWGDERCVPPDDPRSNYGMTARTRLLDRPFASIHRMRGEAPPEEGAEAYGEEILQRILQRLSPDGEEAPRLDVVLLGLGADGHTASLFPGSEGLSEDAPPVIATEVYDGTRRLSMTLPLLLAARQLVFLVTGADKASTLGQVLETEAADGGERSLPAQVLMDAVAARRAAGRRHPGVIWLVDEAAAALLTARGTGFDSGAPRR